MSSGSRRGEASAPDGSSSSMLGHDHQGSLIAEDLASYFPLSAGTSLACTVITAAPQFNALAWTHAEGWGGGGLMGFNSWPLP